MLAVLVQDELAERSDVTPRRQVHADQPNRLGDRRVADRRVNLVLQHGEDFDRRRHGGNMLPDRRFANLSHVAFGIRNPIEIDPFDDDVG